jgi:hypothetical protein
MLHNPCRSIAWLLGVVECRRTIRIGIQRSTKETRELEFGVQKFYNKVSELKLSQLLVRYSHGKLVVEEELEVSL